MPERFSGMRMRKGQPDKNNNKKTDPAGSRGIGGKPACAERKTAGGGEEIAKGKSDERETPRGHTTITKEYSCRAK